MAITDLVVGHGGHGTQNDEQAGETDEGEHPEAHFEGLVQVDYLWLG